ncbi:MAG: AMP-binding protein [Archangium sp.]
MTVPLMVELARLASVHPKRPALTCGEQSLTFDELEKNTNRLARALQARGVVADDFVTIALPNSVEFYEAVIASWKCGATPQPMSTRMPDAERQAVLELVKPKIVLTPESISRADLSKFADDALPTVTSTSCKAPLSGGSTGRPKLIVSLQPATTEFLGLAEAVRVPQDGVHLVTGPLHHNGPLLFSLIALLRGNHLVVMPKFDATQALELIARHRVDWMYAVPTMMQRIWRLPEATRNTHDLSSLRTILHLAAPCPAWLKLEWINWLGPERVWELYAATEVQAVTVIGGADWLTHRGSVGRPVVGELEILSLDGKPLPRGEVGEVWMRRGPEQGGPYRYVGATARTRAGNWESVGDMGHLDAEGYLYLADRQTDMILVGGSNVYPAEIEAALEAHPRVSSACVIGLPDEDLGSVPHAIVQVNGEVADAALLAHCKERLSTYKLPRTFERVQQPLRDEAGKVRRSALRAERIAK